MSDQFNKATFRKMTHNELNSWASANIEHYRVSGPWHEHGGKYLALLNGEWVGNGFSCARFALEAICVAHVNSMSWIQV